MAENAIRLLHEVNLIDRDFSVKNDGRTLTIPLVRAPKRAEFETLRHKVAGAVVRTNDFEPRKRPRINLEEALAGEIPEESVQHMPRSFDIIGDIAVLELSPDLSSSEKKLAKAILDVHPNVKAVFAKAGPVSGPERVRPLHHILGEERTVTVHREFGCSFKVDLSKVFFSPRLSTEHQRVARQVAEGETVVDMFAGVGPFSILIARSVKDVNVHAIDSNPAAVELIRENVKSNKVGSKVHVHRGDAKEVVPGLGHGATRVIMNHPSAARDFVGAACDVLQPIGGVVHYYTFSEGEDCERQARTELELSLESSGHSLRRVLMVHKVREVAPMSWQVAVDAVVIPWKQ
jgi:tRNA (guanine37-N1)-methyltransferase